MCITIPSIRDELVFLEADQGFMGMNAEPNVITDFNGFAALSYLAGRATDTDGNAYDMSNDMRVFQGEYVASDGSHHYGTFCLI